MKYQVEFGGYLHNVISGRFAGSRRYRHIGRCPSYSRRLRWSIFHWYESTRRYLSGFRVIKTLEGVEELVSSSCMRGTFAGSSVRRQFVTGWAFTFETSGRVDAFTSATKTGGAGTLVDVCETIRSFINRYLTLIHWCIQNSLFIIHLS